MGDKDVRYRISLEDKFSQGLRKANNSAASFEKRITKVGKTLTGVFAGAMVVRFASQATKAIIDTTAAFEGFSNAITFLSGSADKGAESMAFLEKNSKDLGLSLEASIEGFQTLAGGFKGTGTSLETIKTIFQKTSIAASAMNLSGERTKLVLLALGQMASKGVVSMEELRRQLGDSLPGAAGIAARSMNMTTQNFNKLVESGKLLSKDFLPGFADELEKTFGKGLAKSTKSVRANLNRMENSFFTLKAAIGKKFEPQLKKSIKSLTKFADTAKRLVKIPVHKTLEAQRKELNTLILSLNDSNKSEAERLILLDKIKEIAPDIIKDIKKEGDNYKIATEALNKFNQEQLNRIVLAKKQEEIDKFRIKATNAGAGAQEALLKIQTKRADAIFIIGKKSSKDAELVQSILDGTITKESKLGELREKFGEENAVMLNQSGIMTSRNSKEFVNAQNIAIQNIARRNKLTNNQIGLDEEFFDLMRRFNPLLNEQNRANWKANQLQGDKLKLAKALGLSTTTVTTTPSPELAAGIQTIKSAAPKTININIG